MRRALTVQIRDSSTIHYSTPMLGKIGCITEKTVFGSMGFMRIMNTLPAYIFLYFYDVDYHYILSP